LHNRQKAAPAESRLPLTQKHGFPHCSTSTKTNVRTNQEGLTFLTFHPKAISSTQIRARLICIRFPPAIFPENLNGAILQQCEQWLNNRQNNQFNKNNPPQTQNTAFPHCSTMQKIIVPTNQRPPHVFLDTSKTALCNQLKLSYYGRQHFGQQCTLDVVNVFYGEIQHAPLQTAQNAKPDPAPKRNLLKLNELCSRKQTASRVSR